MLVWNIEPAFPTIFTQAILVEWTDVTKKILTVVKVLYFLGVHHKHLYIWSLAKPNEPFQTHAQQLNFDNVIFILSQKWKVWWWILMTFSISVPWKPLWICSMPDNKIKGINKHNMWRQVFWGPACWNLL